MARKPDTLEYSTANLSLLAADSSPVISFNTKKLLGVLKRANFELDIKEGEDPSVVILEFFELIRSKHAERVEELETLLRHSGNSHLIPHLHHEKVYSSQEIDTLCKLFPEIDVRVKHAESYVPPSKMVYKMGSSPKGLALIINNKKFDEEEERFGSDRDFKYLCQLIADLGYQVFKAEDLTANEMKNVLLNFSQLPDHKDNDSCIVAISTHGKDRHSIEGTDSCLLDVDDDIATLFNNENCPSLRGKPKLFFIQACRGTLRDNGVDVVDAKAYSSPVSRSPTWTDMIIVQSTIPGYVSNRHLCEGSWFIQSLVKVIMNNANKLDLETMLKMVTASVVQYQTRDEEMQAPEVILRGWMKSLYFNPGQYDSSDDLTKDDIFEDD